MFHRFHAEVPMQQPHYIRQGRLQKAGPEVHMRFSLCFSFENTILSLSVPKEYHPFL
jgi:hypothetical protein